MPTVRNAKGADLYAASTDEIRVLPIQSKALAKRNPVPLGGSLENLCSRWWVITIDAISDRPRCFVLSLDEVKVNASRNVNKDGKVSFWLQPNKYCLPEYEEAWNRLGEP